jgi:hypothetical protein
MELMMVKQICTRSHLAAEATARIHLVVREVSAFCYISAPHACLKENEPKGDNYICSGGNKEGSYFATLNDSFLSNPIWQRRNLDTQERQELCAEREIAAAGNQGKA